MNDLYVFVMPSTKSVHCIYHEFHMWEFTEDVLMKHDCIGFVGAPSSMSVHMPDAVQKTRGGLNGKACEKGTLFEFTIDHHRWWKRGEGGAWVEQ